MLLQLLTLIAKGSLVPYLTFIITVTELRYAALTLTLIAKGSLVLLAVFSRSL